MTLPVSNIIELSSYNFNTHICKFIGMTWQHDWVLKELYQTRRAAWPGPIKACQAIRLDQGERNFVTFCWKDCNAEVGQTLYNCKPDLKIELVLVPSHFWPSTILSIHCLQSSNWYTCIVNSKQDICTICIISKSSSIILFDENWRDSLGVTTEPNMFYLVYICLPCCAV